MAGPLLYDRVKETSIVTGTGAASLLGAVSGFRTFASTLGNGNWTFYLIVHRTAAEWEVGVGTLTTGSPDSLSRDRIISSSNSNAAVTFTSGLKDVILTAPANQLQSFLNLAQVRLDYSTTTAVKLNPYIGTLIEVNGRLVDVTTSGLTLATTDNLISSTGTDSGGAMGTSTLYYVYVSNADASFAPTDIRASTTAPSAHRGDFYLGTSGNAANWRHVGWVYTNASTQFADSDTSRHVKSRFNRIKKRLFSVPGYTNDDAATSFSLNSATWVQLNGGTGTTLSFIADGSEYIEFFVQFYAAGGAVARIGISELDQTTKAIAEGYSNGSTGETISTRYTFNPSAGRHTVDFLGNSGGAVNIFTDDSRNGSTADPYLGHIGALIEV